MVRNLIVLLVCFASALLAQPQQGTLSGTLGGLNGKGKAVLILTDVNTGASQRVTPGADGSFSVSLPPGTYRVEVERDGFRQTATQNVTIAPGTNSQLNVTIEGGPTIEAVEIKATSPGAQDTPPEVGRGFTTSIVRTVPVFDRNYEELNGLMTGVTPPVTAFPLTIDPQGSRQYNVNGLPAYANDKTTNGISIREPYTNEISVRLLPDEAVQQLNVTTDTYPARQGFAGGAISNVFPRPGTNGLHGSLFGFVTDDFFRTRDPFNQPGNPDPTLHDRQFGATIGGALIRDRLFFFGSYQGDVFDGSTLQFATVPTPSELTGNFSALGVPIFNPFTGASTGAGRSLFAGGIIPTASINRVAAAYLSALPAANEPGFANNLARNVPYKDRGNTADGRLDYHFTNNVTGFLDYGWSSFNAAQNSIFGPVLGGTDFAGLRNQRAALSIVGNYHGVIAEVRFGYSRYRNLLTDQAQNAALSSQLAGFGFGANTAGMIPSVTINGLGTLGTPVNLPTKNVDNMYEGEANFHVYRGRNQIVFGADVRDLSTSGFPNFPFGAAGSFFFGSGPTSLLGASGVPGAAFAQSFASFLLGAPTTSGVFVPSATPTYQQRQYGGFVGDMIRFHHLTIDLGARYEVYSPVATNNTTVYNRINNTVGSTQTIGSYYYKNIQPRIGLAFRLTDNTVIRAAYAITSFPLPFNLLPVNPVGLGTSQGVVGGLGFSPFAVSNPPVPQVNTSNAANVPYYVNALSRDPYVQSYNFMIQQSVPWGFLLDAAYVGNVTRELPFIQQLNAATPGSGLAALPLLASGQTAAVYLEGQGLTSNYNSLQVNLSKRLAKGASFNVAYTYSKALDYGTNLIDPFNVRANYGASDWDRQHMLTIGHIFDLPFGAGTNRWNQGFVGKVLGNWKINGLFHWATGMPYNIFADPTGCACPGLQSVLASAAAGAGVNGQASFNPALFPSPAAGSFGNLGRNAIRGPNFTVYNLSLFKTFPVRENTTVELRAESYNLLNSTQFGNPYSNVSFGNFGAPSNISLLNGLFGGGGRTFVLGARILF